MEWAQGDLEAARRLFSSGAEVPRAYQHPPLYEAWSRMEAEAGNEQRAQALLSQSRTLGAPRKPADAS
jgi:hypothetical protein